MTRPSRAGWVRFPHSPATISVLSLISLVCCTFPLASTQAQGTDSTLASGTKTIICKKPGRRPANAPTVPKIVIAGTVERPAPQCRVPLSPRAALLRSLLVPGLGQFNLYRPKAGALFVTAEALSIGMAIKSRHDLNLAAAARRDTTIIPVTDATGKPVIDPVTGLPKTIGQPKNQNLADRVKARRTHLEDWIAATVFNHLFSGADAWVAANLADFDANLNVTAVGRGVQVAARIAW